MNRKRIVVGLVLFNVFAFLVLCALILYAIVSSSDKTRDFVAATELGTVRNEATIDTATAIPEDEAKFFSTFITGDQELQLGDFLTLYQFPSSFDQVTINRYRRGGLLEVSVSDPSVLLVSQNQEIYAIGPGKSNVVIKDRAGAQIREFTIAVEQPAIGEEYQIGDIGPGGGVVFYDKGTSSDGWRYLEAAPDYVYDFLSGRIRFWVDLSWTDEVLKNSESYHIETTSPLLGAGEDNTRNIVGFYGEGDYPASMCAALVLHGKDDWFLPSADELEELLQVIEERPLKINLSKGSYYWSSTLADVFVAYVGVVGDEAIQTLAILNEARFRSIRRF
jgi:hypothetical protein